MGMVGCFAAVDRETFVRLKSDPSLIEVYLYPNDGDDEAPNSIDVDKAWHGIHFMLTGKADGGDEPLALAVLGGEEVGGDVGYGPARFIEPEQVKAVAQALNALSVEAFAARFAPEPMQKAEVYPDIWVRDGQEALDYVLENYQLLVTLYTDAAQRGDGVIAWLS
jgi:Domain of unknown function (DUF1877)